MRTERCSFHSTGGRTQSCGGAEPVGNGGLHGDGLHALVASLKQISSPQLANVNMINCILDEDDCAAIADLLDSVPSVQKLWLGWNYLGTAGVASLREPLIKSNVELLDLA